MTHDYLAALKWAEDAECHFNSPSDVYEPTPAYEAVRHALLVADRLMQEPSREMIKAAWVRQFLMMGSNDEEADALAEGSVKGGLDISISAFKAMRDQMLAELKPAQGGEDGK